MTHETVSPCVDCGKAIISPDDCEDCEFFFEGGKMKYKQEAVQGDVVFTMCVMPTGLKRVERKNGRLVIAEGEATGHAHVVDSPDAILWQDPVNKTLYLQALKEVKVTHEEHQAAVLSAKTYKIDIVNEYDYFLEETRKAID